MQTSLMFLDLKPLGVTAGSQKIAIRMPDGQSGLNADEYAGFSDIINALMALSPEQLQNSLGEMELVKVQGDDAGYAPLIDLSAVKANGSGVAQMLVGEMGSNNLEPAGSLNASVADKAGLDGQNIVSVKSVIEKFAEKDFPERHLDPAKEGTSQPVIESTKEGVYQPALESGKAEILGDLKNVQKHLQLSKIPGMLGEDGNIKVTVKEGPLVQKDTAFGRQIKNTVISADSIEKGLSAAAPLAEEMTSKSTQKNEPGLARGVALRNDAGVKANGLQAAGQQFGDGTDGDPEPFMKQDAKDRPASDVPNQNFKPSQWESSPGLSADPAEPLVGDRQDSKELAQQAFSRIKSAPEKTVEYVSGQKEPASQTSEMQSNVIRQIVQRMTLHTQGSQSTMTLKLKPEFLGNVHMQISTDNQQVVVRMGTESTAVKEMVEQGLQYLKTEMQQHGLEIDKFEVFVANDDKGSNPGQDLSGFRQTHKQRKQNTMSKGANSHRDKGAGISAASGQSNRVTDNSAEIDYFA